MIRVESAGSGPAVLFLHGAPSTPRVFRSTVERLKTSRECLVATLPGYGGVPQLAPYSWDEVTAELEATLAERNVKEVDVVGHSGGTVRAFLLALSGRVRVRKIVALGPTFALPPEGREAYRGLAQALRTPAGAAILRAQVVPALMTPEFRARDDDDVRDVLSWADAIAYDALADELEAFADLPHSLEELKGVTAQVLLRVGSRDTNTPPALAEALRGLLPNATLDVVPDCAHALPYEDPHNAETTARFLLGD